ncbi:glutathione peroxidase [Comamonas sp.]|uniref:glutathione peroxidase n=1 Tax=Comamonas sp. TaxID=34028 RepID=UPI00289B35AA|nr:glutathione peroxidase [Comamonas sp.]
MPATPHTIQDFVLHDASAQPLPLSRYAGQVVLVVNTATACGFTPQLKGLEALQQQYGAQGLQVLGVPCNQFGAQASGSNAEIAQFCELNYQTSYPSLAKVEVNGPHTDPLFAWLKAQAPGILGGRILWNFTKFLVGRDGRTVQRFAPMTQPAKLEAAIEKALAAS